MAAYPVPDVPVTVAYLPSPLSTYEAAGATATIQGYLEGRGKLFPSELVWRRSDEISKMIESATRAQGAAFLDARPTLRAITLKSIAHGPNDWKHFNERGYRALGSLVANHLRGAISSAPQSNIAQ